MRNALTLLPTLIITVFALGCQSQPKQSENEPRTAPAGSAHASEKPAAYLDGQVVTQAQLYRLIAPSHGGEALAEILLDRAVQARLQQENIQLDEADIEAERIKLLASLDPDPDQAARLLQEMRAKRGLNRQRYDALLRRNAGLRRLVRDAITVNAPAVQQAYTLRYGTRYRVRLMTADSIDTLSKARRRVLEGASFTDLVIEGSTDPSVSQGGLLSPISPADATYPKAIRDALPRLAMDRRATRLSTVIALSEGYALLWLEGLIEQGGAPSIDQVRSELEAAVRADLERVRMRQLARTFIEQADVIVLDPALGNAWTRQLESLRSR